MDDYVFPPVTVGDAAAVTALLAAAEAADRTEEYYAVEEVAEELENPMIDLARDWVVVEQAGEVVAQCRLLPRSPADGVLGVGVDGVVHPDHRRRGIGSRLVPMLVERAHAYVAERGPDLRPIVSASSPSDLTDVEQLMGVNGLRPHRWSFLMLADLAGPGRPEPDLPDGYTLSTWAEVSDEEIRAAHNRAFVDHPGWTPWDAEMWQTWVSGSRSLRPGVSLLARAADGAIAAYVQTNEYDAVAEATGVREAYVVKVGTLPEHRKRGLATTLLQVGLERFRADGFGRAGLDVDSENPTGALAVYERVGFTVHRRWTNYRQET